MITLSGFRPDEDIDIQFTGVRPGEKLFEELRTEGENIEPTVHPKIRIWKCQAYPWERVAAAIDELSQLQTTGNHSQIVEAIRRIVPEYQPMNSPSKAPPPGPADEGATRIAPQSVATKVATENAAS
jgi:FlaA1/EpsC-like NDP-sugar epimerase